MNKGDLPLRVVFDCMIYLQATMSDSGPAATLLRLVDKDALTLIVSDDILEEVRGVLSRPQVRTRNSSITPMRVEDFIHRLRAKAQVVSNIQQHFTGLRDPKDEKYLNLAIEAEANYIISRDKDLLDLMTGYTDKCKAFRRKFRTLKIISPTHFLTIMTSKGIGLDQ